MTISLEDVDVSVSDWDSLYQANFEKIQDYINNKLDPDLIVTHNNSIVVHDGNVVVNERGTL